jgi:hypothetical protein
LGQTAAGTGLSKAQKAAIVFPDENLEVIYGMLLSDACFQQDKRYPNSNVCLRIEQKDKDFVYHLWEICNTIGIVGASS